MEVIFSYLDAHFSSYSWNSIDKLWLYVSQQEEALADDFCGQFIEKYPKRWQVYINQFKHAWFYTDLIVEKLESKEDVRPYMLRLKFLEKSKQERALNNVPLSRAIINHPASVVKQIADAMPADKLKEQLEFSTIDESTLLTLAIKKNPAAVPILLEKILEHQLTNLLTKPDTNLDTVLMIAIRSCKTPTIKAILKALPEDQLLTQLSLINQSGNNVLMLCAEHTPKLLPLFLEKISPEDLPDLLNKTNSFQCSVIALAIKHRADVAVIQQLLLATDDSTLSKDTMFDGNLLMLAAKHYPIIIPELFNRISDEALIPLLNATTILEPLNTLELAIKHKASKDVITTLLEKMTDPLPDIKKLILLAAEYNHDAVSLLCEQFDTALVTVQTPA